MVTTEILSPELSGAGQYCKGVGWGPEPCTASSETAEAGGGGGGRFTPDGGDSLGSPSIPLCLGSCGIPKCRAFNA